MSPHPFKTKSKFAMRVNYKIKRVFILYILTHAEYSKGDWKR